MCWFVFEVTVGSSNFPRRFHPKVSKGLSGFNAVLLAPWSVGGRLEPRLNLGSSQIVVIVGFGTWVPGLVEPGFQNLGSRTQVRTTFAGGKVVRTQVEQLVLNLGCNVGLNLS